MRQLAEAGWQAPTGCPAESTPENDPDGSPNFFRGYGASVTSQVIAEDATAALARILRVPHPGFLAYTALDTEGNALAFPQLRLKREIPEEGPGLQSIARRLLSALRKITGIGDLEYDKDGDISLRYGSVSVLIRLVGQSAYGRFYAPLVSGVKETDQLLARINELNSNIGHMHFFVREQTIFAVSDCPIFPLHERQLSAALERFCDIADGMDDLLKAEFGGGELSKAALIN